MPKTPRIDGRQLIRSLKQAGFQVLRIKGSHHFLRHPDGRCTVVPIHSGEKLGPGLLQRILNQTEMTIEDLRITK